MDLEDVFVLRLRHEHELALHVVEYLTPQVVPLQQHKPSDVRDGRDALARAACDSP